MARLQVLVAGSGVMGRGIARSFAEAGLSTAVLSRNPGKVSGFDPRIEILAEPPKEAPELVLESIPEVMELKRELYARLEAAWAGEPILASNTSALPLQGLADGLRHPERFVGVHYFQPADVTPVVEVVAGPSTPRATVERVADVMRRTGKDPIVLWKPIAGFLINRLQHAILHEAYHLIETGVCAPGDVDRVAKTMLGPRMCITGLIEQKDISGLTIHAKAQQAIVPHLAHDRVPNRWVQAMIGSGDLGIKTGRGFYDW